MSDEIKVGDLVMVVRGTRCCGYSGDLGVTFKVQKIQESPAHKFACCYCDAIRGFTASVAKSTSGAKFFVYRLMRIDPPALTEESENKRELVV